VRDSSWPRTIPEADHRRCARRGKIVLRQLKLRHFRKPFFSRGERPAIYQPQDLLHRLDDDELNAGRRKLYLEFVLPRGSYATILIKRLTRGSNLDD
jgi:tRNA pseudouridine13 synthase